MDLHELRRQVAAIRWFHSIDLGHGIVTPGESDNVRMLARLPLSPSLEGLTVLDVGAWDRAARVIKWVLEGRGSFLGTLGQGRIVVHAWR